MNKSKIKACLLSVLLSSATLTHAAGIPVIDSANLAQNLTNYSQVLLDYTNQLSQLQQQLEIYKREVQDATRPVKSIYDSVHKTFSSLKSTYQGVMNLRSQYKNALEYVQKNYGDSDFWKNCALTACNPFSQLETAYTATTMELNRVIANNNAVNESATSIAQSLDELENEISSASTGGTAENLQLIGKIQTQNAKALLLVQQTLDQYTAALAASTLEEKNRRKAIADQEKNFFSAPANYKPYVSQECSVDFYNK